jgi:geranylgeranyl reductase family protein
MKNGAYDAIIVGGGPAGSLTAYHLAKGGARVALLDAQRFPRDKPCGGGVQWKAAERIPFDWEKVKRGSLHGLTFSYGYAENFTKKYPEPLVHSVLRTEFDELLLRTASDAGAEILEGVKVNSVRNEAMDATVETESGNFAARFVVGADGANSVVRSTVGQRSAHFWQVGLSCEVPEEYIVPGSIDYDCMRVDWGTLPSGYAWIFPKRGFVNIGVGCPSTIGRMLRPYLMEFLDREKVLKPGTAERLKFGGHQLPTLTSETRIARESVLLAGDAAGLIEPFTGDGISFGLHSAEIAAQTILHSLNQPALDAAGYEQRIRNEIGLELGWSRNLQRFFVAFPRMIHEVARRNDKLWAAFCRVLRGEESFRVFRRKLGVFEFLWLPIDSLTARYERRLLANPAATDGGVIAAAK